MNKEGMCRCDARESFTYLTIPFIVSMYAAALDAHAVADGQFPSKNALSLSVDVVRDGPHLIRIVEGADRYDRQWDRWASLLHGLVTGVPTWTRPNALGIAYLVLFDAMWSHDVMPASGTVLSKSDFLEVIRFPSHELAVWLSQNLLPRKVGRGSSSVVVLAADAAEGNGGT